MTTSTFPTRTASTRAAPTRRKTALIIGSGIGGLSLGIRLQSLGFDTTILERLDAPGGRAYQKRTEDGYVFDMGPTVITVPHFIEELFALERDKGMLAEPDYPADVLAEDACVREGESLSLIHI